MRASIFLLASCVLGCGSPTPAQHPETGADEAASLLAAVRTAQRNMHARYAAAQSLVDALTIADMDKVHATAATLQTVSDPEALPRWQPYIAEVQGAAGDLAYAANLRAAASGAALLAARCASCHVAIAARVHFADDGQPAKPTGLAQQMLRHRWAAQRLWEGLLGPSNERWIAGAEALISMRFDIVAQSGLPQFSNDVDDAMWVRTYGRRALAARSNSERADVFGDLLITCAHCHAALRSPRP